MKFSENLKKKKNILGETSHTGLNPEKLDGLKILSLAIFLFYQITYGDFKNSLINLV